MKSFYRKRENKGYTLAEILLTVAILLVLMAIAVLAIFTIRKNLRQKALDNKAEIIYTAVQNNLTKLKSNGNSESFAAKRATLVDATPTDAEDEKTLYFVTADQKNTAGSAASVVVTDDTVDADLYEHYWVVEYDPASASVYAVFYSETRDDYSPAAYDPLRYKKNRLKDGARVGYYGGDSIDGSNTSALVPKVTVKNDEKLQIIINCKRPDDNPLSFEVKLTDAEDHVINLKYGTDATGKNLVHLEDDLHLADTSGLDENCESGSIRGNNYTLTLTLDALQPSGANKDAASRFTELYGSGNATLKSKAIQALTPGSDLLIRVKVRSDSSLIDGLSASASTNSLFGNDSTDEEAEILYGRHLQNLDQSSGVTEKITSAVQKSNIDFQKENTLEGEDTDTTSWYSCYGDLAFHPITNDSLVSYRSMAGDTAASEQEQTAARISHLTTEESEKAGLFAQTPDKMQISGIYLESARIKGTTDGTSETYAGALVAYSKGEITLTNCQSYLNAKDLEGKTEKDLWLDGASVQGGLIGRADGKVSLSRCLAATVMGEETTKLTGGLIGQVQKETTIQESYADSYLTGQVTGGLVTQTEGMVQIQNSYTAGYQKAVKTAGGFLAKAGTVPTVLNCYAAVTWLTAEGESQTSPTVRYSTIPLKNGTDDPTRNTWFLSEGTDYDGATEQDQSAGEKISYKELSNIAEMVKKLNGEMKFGEASATNPYNLKNQGLSSYNYPALSGMPHYGDWQASFEAGSLVYYEVYTDETGKQSYGFYGGNITPSLKENEKVTGDGYGVVYQKEEKPQKQFTVLYPETDKNGSTETKTWTMDLTEENITEYEVTVDEAAYVIYPLPAEIVNAAPSKDTYYQKVVIRGADAVGSGQTDEADTENVTGSIFYYNPHVAKSVVTTVENTQKAPSVIAIRTARQLYELSNYYPEYLTSTRKSTFTQEMDIDYSTYEWKTYANEKEAITVQSPIGEKEAFAAIYDGRYHKVQNISLSSSETKVGLFGENAGTIQNLFLVSDYQKNGTNPYLKYSKEIEKNKTVYMGTLAGVNNGLIRNCAVSGYYVAGNNGTIYVRQNGTLYFGGLVGKNTGTIRNSQADTPLVNANVLYGKAYIGGLAGENAAAGKITGSYAIGKAMVEYSKGEKSVIGGFAAKNAGYLASDYCAVTMTAAGSTETYGFAKKGGNISSNCYYLSGGTFQYLDEMETFDNTSGSGTPKTYSEMQQEEPTRAECCSATASENGYPFEAVVRKDTAGNKIHFGNWQLASDLGSFGVLYWEKEEQGSNNGYHFSYIGYTADATSPSDTVHRVSGSTLCQERDDGGIITKYGYAYYYSDQLSTADVTATATGFQTGTQDDTVSGELSARLNGFQVVAFTTAKAIATSAQETKNAMKLTGTEANGVWTLTDRQHQNAQGNNIQYNFTINPFFANAMQYGSETDGELAMQNVKVLTEDGSMVTETETIADMPGKGENQYEIRCAEQLEYMNWNSQSGDAVTTLDEKNYKEKYTSYTYLGQMAGQGNAIDTTRGKYSWLQTHDVDANMTPGGTEVFTQIGSLYDANRVSTNQIADAYMTYFTGSYDGNTYSIKNIEIHSSNTVVGLFGSIIGAQVQNIILYSDRGNYIQRNENALESWYALGGMCGLAAVGLNNKVEDAKIVNCTVSGYTIQDNSKKCSYGGVNVGGMFGISTLDLEKCTAVNKIVLNMQLQRGFSIRVGGLAGSMRGNVNECYTGGEISCTEKNQQYLKKSGVFLCLGGINGGIFIKNDGNLVKLLGYIKGVTDYRKDVDNSNNEKKCGTATTSICNCYTYIKMPGGEETEKIQAIEPIGGNGETHDENDRNKHVRIEIRNCYYYEANIPVSKNTTIPNKNWNNIDSNAEAVTWSELASDTFPSRLNGGSSADFGKVTTMENGYSIDGKYTFPGNRRDLEGQNYPFPTILTQNTTDGISVNVHYGEWPLEGMSWEESRAGMDIFENLVTEEGDDQGKALKKFILRDEAGNIGTDKASEIQFTYQYGDEPSDPETPDTGAEKSESMLLDEQNRIAEVSNIEYDNTVGAYVATIWAHKTGTEEITASVKAKTRGGTEQTYTATFTLTITADLVAYADSETVSLKKGVNTALSLHAVPMNSYTGMDTDIVTEQQSLDDDPQSAVEEQSLELQNEPVQTEQMVLYGESATVDESDDECTDEGSTEEMTDGEIQMLMETEDSEEAESVITPYEDLAMETDPEKDLAPYMNWTIESADSEQNYISVSMSEEQKNRMTIFCYADLEQDMSITLTITGTYTYEGVEYTTTAWVEVVQDQTSVQIADESGNIYTPGEEQENSSTVIDDGTSDEIVVNEEETDSTETDTTASGGEETLDNSTDGSDEVKSESDSQITEEQAAEEDPTETGMVVGIE